MDAFKKQLYDQLNSLQDLAAICALKNDNEETVAQLTDMASMISSLEKTVSEYQNMLVIQEEEVIETERAIKEAEKQADEISLIGDMIPEEIVSKKPLQSSEKENEGVGTEVKSILKKSPIPQLIDHITADEFESLPNYLKGRVNVKKVNNAVDEVVSFLNSKAQLLSCKSSELRHNNDAFKLYKQYRSEILPSAKDQVFFTMQDLLSNESITLKNDNTSKTILGILRYFGRIKHTSSQGIVRYVVQNV